MRPGDLVRIVDVVWMFHDSSLSSSTVGRRGELVVALVLDPLDDPYGLFAQVLHPVVGVCYILKQRLEVIDDTSPTLRPATR